MVTEPTARQRPQPVPAIVAATAGLALALFGSAPAAAEPPGVPAGAPTQGAQRYDHSYPRVPLWLDPAREPVLRPDAVPAPDPTDEPLPPSVEPTPPAHEPTDPAEEPTPSAGEPTPSAVEPSRPAAEPRPPKPSPSGKTGRPDRTENHPNPAPPPAAYERPADPPADQAQSGQGGELAARPITEVPDTRGLDERVPTVLPSPTPADPATATRLASSATNERPDGFARSLIYSGLIGLAIALYGLSMVGRRRRTW